MFCSSKLGNFIIFNNRYSMNFRGDLFLQMEYFLVISYNILRRTFGYCSSTLLNV